jgi:hypothetical protein
MESQQCVHQVLNIVFIDDSDCLAVAVTIQQLVGEHVKTLAQPYDQRFCVATIPPVLPVLLDFGFQNRCDDSSQKLMQHRSSRNISILQDVEYCALKQGSVHFLSGW